MRRPYALLIIVGSLVAASAARAEAPPGRYELRGGGLVRDTVTGLLWTVSAVGSGLNLRQAVDACSALQRDGLAGFRLPTRQELLTLIDLSTSASGYAIDASVFQDVGSLGYWTSTRSIRLPGWWAISAATGTAFPADEGTSLAVRCVRGTP